MYPFREGSTGRGNGTRRAHHRNRRVQCVLRRSNGFIVVGPQNDRSRDRAGAVRNHDVEAGNGIEPM